MSQNKETEIQLQYIEKCKELLAKNSAKHPTFHIQNEGCQMNSIQTESIAAIMEKMDRTVRMHDAGTSRGRKDPQGL